TVRDNIMVGGHCGSRGGFLANALCLPFVGDEERRLGERADALIETLGLAAVCPPPGPSLTLSARQRRAPSPPPPPPPQPPRPRPGLRVAEGPAGGSNPGGVEALGPLIVAIRRRFDLTILLVEHHMAMVTRVSDHVVVLNFGRKIAEGTPAAIQANPDVISAY